MGYSDDEKKKKKKNERKRNKPVLSPSRWRASYAIYVPVLPSPALKNNLHTEY